MRYLVIHLVTVFLVALGGCSSISSNNAQAINSATPKPIQTVAVSDGLTPTDCKICDFDHSGYKGELKKEEIDGLLLALNDEYLATATYEQVNKNLGDPRPFVNIVEAERRHADMLKELFTKYGITVPENPWPDSVPKFASVAEACTAGVEGEIANRDLYTRLFKSTKRPDILETYRYLQRASEENHLPAFERCGGGGGNGRRGGGPR